MGVSRPHTDVTALLDTNVLVRHFTGEPPDQARRASAFLRAAGPRELVLVDLAAAELVFVLQSVYRQPPWHSSKIRSGD